ncbi:MAG: PH domain-containing protein [Pseudomonadota bacterium]
MQHGQDTNLTMALEPEDIHILERSEARTSGVPLFTAHWHIFIPTLVIAILYSVAWITLATLGKADSGLARLFIVVMAVGVPLLAVHAFLRYQTIRLQVSDGHVFCHPGWPKELPIDVPVSVIREIKVKRGLAGRVFGGGTIILSLVTEGDVVVADLAQPELARQTIEAELANN